MTLTLEIPPKLAAWLAEMPGDTAEVVVSMLLEIYRDDATAHRRPLAR
jgi:hypothetical protein